MDRSSPRPLIGAVERAPPTFASGARDIFGNTIERLHTDAGYRGHNAPPEYKFKVYTAKQKRRVTPQIKREMRRRSAIEPVIGHLKNEHRMDRNYLAGRNGDANNAILAAVGYNFRRLIRWLTLLLAILMVAISPPTKSVAT
jgi:IS5 family transposase